MVSSTLEPQNDQTCQPKLQVTTPTSHLSKFLLKTPFKFIIFALCSTQWKDHLALRKMENTQVDWNWPKHEHGDLNSVLHRDLSFGIMPNSTWDHFSHVKNYFPWSNASHHNTKKLGKRQNHKFRANFSHDMDLNFSDLIHTFEIQFHTNFDLTLFHINRETFWPIHKDSIAKKFLPHWNSKAQKNQLTIPLI